MFQREDTDEGLFAAACVAAHELINATGRIDELALTGVEGVRAGRDFELYHGILFAFEFHGLGGLSGRTAEEHIAIAHVLEDNRAIVSGMNTLFHCFE